MGDVRYQLFVILLGNTFNAYLIAYFIPFLRELIRRLFNHSGRKKKSVQVLVSLF